MKDIPPARYWCCQYLCQDKQGRPYLLVTCGGMACEPPPGEYRLVNQYFVEDCKHCPVGIHPAEALGKKLLKKKRERKSRSRRR